MIFSTLEHILTHISFSIVSIVITIHLITFLVNEIVKLYDSSEKGIIVTFFCITGLLVTPDTFGINKGGKVFGTLMGIFITLAKTYLFLFIPIATRWTLPRLRMDQLLNLGWKFLLPISLGNLLLTTSSQLLSL